MVHTLIAITINIKHAEENILLQSQQVKYVDSTAAVYMHVNHENHDSCSVRTVRTLRLGKSSGTLWNFTNLTSWWTI